MPLERNDDRSATAEELRGSLEDLPCFQLYVGWRRAQALYKPLLDGQPPQRMYLLHLLSDREELGVTSIARALDLDVASASGLISRMENEGLVRRKRSSDNRLEVRVRLTQVGREAHDRRAASIEALDKELLDSLRPADLKGLRRIVGRIGDLLHDARESDS